MPGTVYYHNFCQHSEYVAKKYYLCTTNRIIVRLYFMSVMKHLLQIIIALCLLLAGCGRNSEIDRQLDRADALIESRPDSSLLILDKIDAETLSDNEQKARHALLKSMALDKNYIDTTTFDVLQPAIDYYLEKGAPNDKLRTYYYQGVIFQNQGNRDKALNSHIKGLDIAQNSTDSLTIARTLNAVGLIYHELFDTENYVSYCLRAASIYNKLHSQNNELYCLFNALNGAILSGNQNRGDSIINHIEKFSSLDSLMIRELSRYKLSYALTFGSIDDIQNLIPEREENLSSQNDVLDLAWAYNKIDNNEKAIQLLDFIKNSGEPYDTLRYLSISVPTLEGLRDYKGALLLYQQFSQKQDSINFLKFELTSKSIEDKHRIELQAQKDARLKSRIIWGCIGGIIILTLAFGILYLVNRNNKSKKQLTEAENAHLKSEHERLALEKNKIVLEYQNLQLENDKKTLEAENLVLEREQLTLENRNLQLERDNKALEAENLAHRVETLEGESRSLKELIATSVELPEEVQKAIQVRIEMLNSLLASYITSNEQFEKPYDIWVKELTDNTEVFMNSNRLAFQASHPRFIQYFEEHGLTEDEINYVCLYAIGLRGKEVGNYMKKPGHVNISSAIRKKLGIDKHETNIGIYVRKLLKSL